MKKLLVLSALAGSFVLPQTAKASDCDYAAAYEAILFASITSAPTGTTMLTQYDCREEVLAVREEAKQFVITGEASSYLQSIFNGAKSVHPEMSNEDFAANIIAGSSNL